jgi:hypothetical protein
MNLFCLPRASQNHDFFLFVQKLQRTTIKDVKLTKKIISIGVILHWKKPFVNLIFCDTHKSLWHAEICGIT